MTAVSELKTWEEAHCCHVVFLDGLPIAYTDDESGDLLGSGADSWIGRYEDAHAHETVGQREIRGGLIMPTELASSLDLKEGWPQQSQVSFSIVDLDGHLVDLFGTDGKPYDTIVERIPPGLDDLPAQALGPGGVGDPKDLHGRNIGTERIGPNGERRQCPALPFQLIGPDHPATQAGLPELVVSDDPLAFAGRMVTVYRIFRDPNATASGHLAWPTWDEHEAAGCRIWHGTMRDSGKVTPSREWEIQCFGEESLLKRKLGGLSPRAWMPIIAGLPDDESKRQIAIGLADVSGGDRNTRAFDSSVFQSANELTAGDRATLIGQINSAIQDARDATTSNLDGPNDELSNWTVATAQPPGARDAEVGCELAEQARFYLKLKANQNPDGGGEGHRGLIMDVCMHESRWALLGFDPKAPEFGGQNVKNADQEDEFGVRFDKQKAGNLYAVAGLNSNDLATVPDSGYYTAHFHSCEVGYYFPDSMTKWDNGGARRYFRGKYDLGAFEVDPAGGQVLTMPNEPLYLEGQPTVTPSGTVQGQATTHARHFVMRGQFRTVGEDGEPTEPEERFAVFRGSWREGSTHGSVLEDDSGRPLIHVDKFFDPRPWGFDDKPMVSPWIGTIGGDAPIEIVPLNAYAYNASAGSGNTPERAHDVLSQVMYSSGTTDGNTKGDNDPGLGGFLGDVELDDLGLRIPHQLVGDIGSAFESLPGQYSGPLQRVRYAYVGPFQSRDLLQSITTPRGLWWSLVGGRYGLFRIDEIDLNDPDLLVITEDDIAGSVGQPWSTYPSQEQRATGQIDETILSYRNVPSEGQAPDLEFKAEARDPRARSRIGDLEHRVTDHGLMPIPYFGNQLVMQDAIGVGDWRPSFRQLWGDEMARFFERRHFMVEAKISRTRGQDARIGTPVVITNPWPVDGSGYGMVAKAGRVVGTRIVVGEGSTIVQVLVFGGQGNQVSPPHFSPVVRIVAVNSDVLTYDDSQPGMSVSGFTAPAHVSAANLDVAMYQRLGHTWVITAIGEVEGVDTDAQTITLRTPGLTPESGQAVLRDRDKLLVAGEWGTHASSSWPRQVYAPIVDSTLANGRPWL